MVFVLMPSVILTMLLDSLISVVIGHTCVSSANGDPVLNGKDGKDPNGELPLVTIFDKLPPGKYTPTNSIPYTVETPDDDVRN